MIDNSHDREPRLFWFLGRLFLESFRSPAAHAVSAAYRIGLGLRDFVRGKTTRPASPPALAPGEDDAEPKTRLEAVAAN